ncbi:hypothetical protein HRR83_007041 [Exophiala dermatitidis]|nr:hypothetical protein HRR75_005770 [Exophiala dermatitidis]KAJ4512525.1 hypothetical protein HRR73_006080 [Exophiala dermatitidis]KAJ4546663.1 hypothetical protein HRR78_005664 [Exophiala dermatitidis]KAJ4592483.1 hypothetical protein HRR83_007041 [Exophiala dermatitidis]KAJ4621975.1 hypothetical protein HRR86_006297 [Exophiala dermatitidis]
MSDPLQNQAQPGEAYRLAVNVLQPRWSDHLLELNVPGVLQSKLFSLKRRAVLQWYDNSWESLFLVEDVEPQNETEAEHNLGVLIDEKAETYRRVALQYCGGLYGIINGNPGPSYIPQRRPLPRNAATFRELCSGFFMAQANPASHAGFKNRTTLNLDVLRSLEARCADEWNSEHLFSEERAGQPQMTFRGPDIDADRDNSDVDSDLDMNTDSDPDVDADSDTLSEKNFLRVQAMAQREEKLSALEFRRDFIKLEVAISEAAMARLDVARQFAEAQLDPTGNGAGHLHRAKYFVEWMVLRHFMLVALRKVHGALGSKSFLKRHQYELWDLVDPLWKSDGVLTGSHSSY